jgi:hypothetical protein
MTDVGTMMRAKTLLAQRAGLAELARRGVGMVLGRMGEGERRMFATCRTVDDILSVAKALGIELADSEVVDIALSL